MIDDRKLLTLTADIVSSYFARNAATVADVPTVIVTVRNALASAGVDAVDAVVAEPITKATPAQIRKSISPDALISFIDGRPYSTLKRHISSRGMTVEEYRKNYGLPADYPMVASHYREQRSAVAKASGLGRRASAPVEVAEPVAPPEAPAKPARKKLRLPIFR